MRNKLHRALKTYQAGGLKALHLVVTRKVLGLYPRADDLNPRADYDRTHIKYLSDVENITVAEIGVWKGDHARFLQEELDINKMYLIDPYDAYEDYEEEKSEAERMRDAEKEAHKKLGEYNNNNNKWIKDYSDVAFGQIPDKLDYVYIDGNHKYKYVKRDVEKYYEMVKPGGVIAGHDFNPSWPGVIRAVTEFAEDNNIELHLENCGTDWFMIK